MLHTGEDAKAAFWQWWQASNCAAPPKFDPEWRGTVGVGAGEDGIKDQPEDDKRHHYINLYLD